MIVSVSPSTDADDTPGPADLSDPYTSMTNEVLLLFHAVSAPGFHRRPSPMLHPLAAPAFSSSLFVCLKFVEPDVPVKSRTTA